MESISDSAFPQGEIKFEYFDKTAHKVRLIHFPSPPPIFTLMKGDQFSRRSMSGVIIEQSDQQSADQSETRSS